MMKYVGVAFDDEKHTDIHIGTSNDAAILREWAVSYLKRNPTQYVVIYSPIIQINVKCEVFEKAVTEFEEKPVGKLTE